MQLQPIKFLACEKLYWNNMTFVNVLERHWTKRINARSHSSQQKTELNSNVSVETPRKQLIHQKGWYTEQNVARSVTSRDCQITWSVIARLHHALDSVLVWISIFWTDMSGFMSVTDWMASRRACSNTHENSCYIHDLWKKQRKWTVNGRRRDWNQLQFQYNVRFYKKFTFSVTTLNKSED